MISDPSTSHNFLVLVPLLLLVEELLVVVMVALAVAIHFSCCPFVTNDHNIESRVTPHPMPTSPNERSPSHPSPKLAPNPHLPSVTIPVALLPLPTVLTTRENGDCKLMAVRAFFINVLIIVDITTIATSGWGGGVGWCVVEIGWWVGWLGWSLVGSGGGRCGGMGRWGLSFNYDK